MISATKTFTSIKRDISNDQKKYYQLPHKDCRNSPHEFAVLRLMMDQTHGCIHSQGTAEDGYPQKRRFWDTPTMLLGSVFVADCQNDSNQIDENQIAYKTISHGFPPKKVPHWGQYRLFHSTLHPQYGQQCRPFCRTKRSVVGSAWACGSRSRRRPSSFESSQMEPQQGQVKKYRLRNRNSGMKKSVN